MECWLKSSREEQSWGQQAAETDNNQGPGTSFTIISSSSSSSHVQSPASPPDPDSLGSGVVDLTLWPPGECSLGLGYNLGFIRQEALSQAALCLIILGSSLFTGHSPEQTHQHSILLTPSQAYDQYLQLTTLFIQIHLNCPDRRWLEVKIYFNIQDLQAICRFLFLVLLRRPSSFYTQIKKNMYSVKGSAINTKIVKKAITYSVKTFEI